MIALRSQMLTIWCLLTAAGTVFAQDEWARVTALEVGVTVQIDTTSQRLRGTLQSATDAGLYVIASGRPIYTSRSDVRRVVRIGERQVKRYALRGLVIGAAAGTALGATTAETNKGPWTAFMAAGWAGVGALIGAINGLDREEELVYQSPALQPPSSQARGRGGRASAIR